MNVIDKPKNLTEKEFTNKLENGYTLFVRYKYSRGSDSYLLIYQISRQRNTAYPYVLTIEEGSQDFDYALDVCSERDMVIKFISIEKAITYLKNKEDFKIEDWTYTSEGRKNKGYT